MQTVQTVEPIRRGRDSGFFLRAAEVQAPKAAPEDRSDDDLVSGMVANEPWAWKEFQRRYDRLIHRCITKVTRRFATLVGQDDVRDIYASLYLSLVANGRHKLRSFDPDRGNRFSSWIGLLAINCAYDYLRSLKREPHKGSLSEASELVCDLPDPYEQGGGHRARRDRREDAGRLQRQGPHLRHPLLRRRARPERDRVAHEHQREDGLLEEAQDSVPTGVGPGLGRDRAPRAQGQRAERARSEAAPSEGAPRRGAGGRRTSCRCWSRSRSPEALPPAVRSSAADVKETFSGGRACSKPLGIHVPRIPPARPRSRYSLRTRRARARRVHQPGGRPSARRRPSDADRGAASGSRR